MYKKVKRVCDVIVSSIALILFSPFLLIIVMLMKVESNGPILFKQRRIGKEKREFNILKFRTMYVDAPKDSPTHLLSNPEKHITKVGKILRKTSLDEIPQLINIIKGDMSIIGPRPALWNQYDLIAERDKYGANNIYPGLSGWAQINGRDELSIEVKANLDGEYVEKISLMMDVKCVIGTIVRVVKSEGVVEGGVRASMEVASGKESINK